MARVEKEDENRLDYALAIQIGVTTPCMLRRNTKGGEDIGVSQHLKAVVWRGGCRCVTRCGTLMWMS
mgnify:CR=1 FL=1